MKNALCSYDARVDNQVISNQPTFSFFKNPQIAGHDSEKAGSNETKETVKIGIGLIATMTALILGLVTASAKSSFDSLEAEMRHTAADVLAFDRTLARYGPETREIRQAEINEINENPLFFVYFVHFVYFVISLHLQLKKPRPDPRDCSSTVLQNRKYA